MRHRSTRKEPKEQIMNERINLHKRIWTTWGWIIWGGVAGIGGWLFLGRYDAHALAKGEMNHWLIEKLIYALLMGGFVAVAWIAVKLRQVIGARDRALDAFRGSQDLYRHIVENAHEMIYEVDMTGKITYVNKAAEKFTGHPVTKILGKRYTDFLPPEFRDSIHRRFIVQVSRLMPVQYVEAPAISGSGGILWLGHTVRLKIENGQPAGFTIISRDITERRSAEEALRASEAILKAVFHQAPVGMVVTDRAGRILSLNDRYARMLGMEEGRIRGRRFTEFTHPEDVLKNATLFGDLIEGRASSYRLEKRNIRGNGVPFWVRVTVSKLTLEKEQSFAIAMVEDIDEWKRAEEMNRQLQSIIEETTDLAAVTDPQGKLLYINAAGRKLLGLTGEESVSRLSPQAFFSPEAIPEVINTVSPRVISEGRWSGILPLTSRQGSTVFVSAVILCHRNDDGSVAHFSAIARDITEERKAQMALERERGLLRTLIEAIPDEIAIKDTERRFVLANSATVRALKKSRLEEIIGKKDEDLIPEPFATNARNEEEELLKTAKPVINAGSAHPRRDPVTGKILRSLLTTKVPLRNEDGAVEGIVVINRDVTVLRQSEEDKEKAILELQKALADVKTLSGLLPICASCKKIRDDDGYWNKIESYLESHTEAQFSHGLCPDCLEIYFPGSTAAKKHYEREREKRNQ